MKSVSKNIKLIITFILVFSFISIKMPIVYAIDLNFYDRMRQECQSNPNRMPYTKSTQTITEEAEDTDSDEIYEIHYNEIKGNVYEILAGKSLFEGEDSTEASLPIEGVCVIAGERRNVYRSIWKFFNTISCRHTKNYNSIIFCLWIFR